jgi:hypothetical protein
VPVDRRREQRREVTAVTLPSVSFRYTYTFLADDAVITSDSTLRFRSREELASGLAAQGYRVLDVREAPDRPGLEFVSSPSAQPHPGPRRPNRGRETKSAAPAGT